MLVAGVIFLIGLLLVSLIGYLLGLSLGYTFHDLEKRTLDFLVNVFGNLLDMMFGFVYLPYLYGYFWETISKVKHKGIHYPELPQWSGHWLQYYHSGVKIYLYVLLFSLPVFFIDFFPELCEILKISDPQLNSMVPTVSILLKIMFCLVGFFLIPFLLVPIYFNEPNSSFTQFFSIQSMLSEGRKHYGNVLKTCLSILAIHIVVGIASVIGGVLTCFIGFLLIPSIQFAMKLSSGLMLLSAYELDMPESKELQKA